MDPELYNRLRPRMLAYLEHRKCTWASELADEALKRIWERLQSDPPDNVNAFAYGVVRLVYLEWLRKNSRYAPLEEAVTAAVSFDPEIEERQRRLRSAISSLSRADRDFIAVVLATDEGSAYVAGVLGITPEGVRSRTFRVKAKLRRIMNGETKPTERNT